MLTFWPCQGKEHKHQMRSNSTRGRKFFGKSNISQCRCSKYIELLSLNWHPCAFLFSMGHPYLEVAHPKRLFWWAQIFSSLLDAHRLWVIVLLLFRGGNQLFSQTLRHMFGCLTPKWKEIMPHSLPFVANHNALQWQDTRFSLLAGVYLCTCLTRDRIQEWIACKEAEQNINREEATIEQSLLPKTIT